MVGKPFGNDLDGAEAAIRAGTCMPITATEVVVVRFHRSTHYVFDLRDFGRGERSALPHLAGGPKRHRSARRRGSGAAVPEGQLCPKEAERLLPEGDVCM